MNWSGVLGTPVERKELDTPKVHDLPGFDYYRDPKKMDVISRIAENASRDPRMATVAVDIIRKAGVAPRNYKAQAAALLAWVQDPKNIYYVNEPDERLQDPFYTLKVKYGDCDDVSILLYSLVRSIRLPARLVISGLDRGGKKVRYVQGQRNFPSGVEWAHIYLQIGDRPYGEPVWYYAEPTLRVPLGWDVVDHDASQLPEMRGQFGAAPEDAPAASGFLSGFSERTKLVAALAAGALVYHVWKGSR
jgi:transglutaminase-like putative cysteine protease